MIVSIKSATSRTTFAAIATLGLAMLAAPSPSWAQVQHQHASQPPVVAHPSINGPTTDHGSGYRYAGALDHVFLPGLLASASSGQPQGRPPGRAPSARGTKPPR
jgi:hypothetical protein